MTPARDIVGDDKAEAAADHLAAAFDAAQVADAAEIIDWLDDTDPVGTLTTSALAAEWDDFDWRFIGEEVGVPTPVGTRNHVVRLLTESGR
jgi:hypothetical protein